MQPSLRGRRLVLGAYILVVAIPIAVVLGAVVSDLYGNVPDRPSASWCAERAVALREELRSAAALAALRPGIDWEGRLGAWRAAAATVRTHCPEALGDLETRAIDGVRALRALGAHGGAA
jgi:hypothetical protein